MTNPITAFFKKLLFVPPVEEKEERVYFILSAENTFAKKLDQLATASGTSTAEVLRRAIGLYAEALKQAEEGKTIKFVEDIESGTQSND